MAKPAKRVYQPIWTPDGIDGRVPYQRPCEDRYETIRALASRFNRPFSVLDIGSNFGYFDVRLMAEFECCCCLVDNKLVGSVLKANDVMDRSAVIFRHLSAVTLESWAKSEHFDIVLGLAVLHHFDEPVRALQAMRQLGSWTVLEVPGEDDIGAANAERHGSIAAALADEVPVGHCPSHVSESERPVYVLENAPYLFEQSLDAADRDAPQYQDYRVRADFDESVFLKGETDERPFVPGVNLWNFMSLGGIWPDQATIERGCEPWRDTHPDFQPWNFVVGFGIQPIDMDPK